jgi:hypothetical protein
MRAVHLVPAAVVLLALGAIGAVASLDRPTASPNPAAVTRQAAVTAAARACPPTLGGGTGTVALIAAPAGPAGRAGPAGPAGPGRRNWRRCRPPAASCSLPARSARRVRARSSC